jgi:hypothetical protein
MTIIDDFDISYGGDGLKEGADYYLSSEGFRIMTIEYLTRRGYCCANGCPNCPYWPKAQKGNRVLRKNL